MSDRAQSIPPTPPPEAPVPSAPEVESERMIRHTWLAAFDEPKVFALLEEIGAGIVHHAREAGLWGLDVPRSMAGIVADLESLALCLAEVADTPTASSVTADDLALCADARRWAGTVAGMVAEIRLALDGDSEVL